MSEAVLDNSKAPLRMVSAILLSGLGAYLLLVLCSYNHNQIGGTTQVEFNLGGQLGAMLGKTLISVWGLAAFLLPLYALGYAFAMFRGKYLDGIGLRLTGAIMLIPIAASLFHLWGYGPGEVGKSLLLRWNNYELGGMGGALGNLLASHSSDDRSGGLLVHYLGTSGSLLILLAGAILALMLMRIGFISYGQRAHRAWKEHKAALAHQAAAAEPAKRDQAQPARGKAPQAQVEAKRPPTIEDMQRIRDTKIEESNRTASSIDDVKKHLANRDSTTNLGAQDLVDRIRARRQAIESDDASSATTSSKERQTAHQKSIAESVASITASAKLSGSALAQPAADKNQPEIPNNTQDVVKPQPHMSLHDIKNEAWADGDSDEQHDEAELLQAASHAQDQSETHQVPVVTAVKPPKAKMKADGQYLLPELNILEEGPARRDSAFELETQETSKTIEALFSEHRIGVKVVKASRGPVITQYELELLDAGMRVKRLEGYESDLAMRLGTEGIRIVAPLPNKKAIGVEVPNRNKEAVVMRDLVEEMDPGAFKLPIILGRDVLGSAVIGDLAKMPHLLTAGATGMGKSVCLNAIICSILLFRSPEDVKFIMVDPKMVELAGYEDIPHLLTPPITDMTKAHAALEWACKTMDERFYALRMVGAREINSYNALGEEEIARRLKRKGKDINDLPGIDVKMPYIVIVVDEYADLMMVNKEVEKSLVRLTAKARACGIHVILTTQRPSADVVTGLIKSNLPSRICFRVADRNNSRVVLDAAGAENLLGRGDMLYLPPGSSALVRGQGVWVKDNEIDAIIEHARSQGDPQYDETITKPTAVAMSGGGSSGDDKASAWLTDRQFHEAIWSMYKYNKTGADFLRRKLGIGYNKATSFVETLEDLGFLGPSKGTRGREFLKSWDDWLDELRANDLHWEEDDEIYTSPFA